MILSILLIWLFVCKILLKLEIIGLTLLVKKQISLKCAEKKTNTWALWIFSSPHPEKPEIQLKSMPFMANIYSFSRFVCPSLPQIWLSVDDQMQVQLQGWMGMFRRTGMLRLWRQHKLNFKLSNASWDASTYANCNIKLNLLYLSIVIKYFHIKSSHQSLNLVLNASWFCVQMCQICNNWIDFLRICQEKVFLCISNLCCCIKKAALLKF